MSPVHQQAPEVLVAIRRTAIYLILLALVCGALTVWLWPAAALGDDGLPRPQGLWVESDAVIVVPGGFLVEFQRDMVILAMLGGALGACVYSLSALGDHAGTKTFDTAWIPWYLVYPIFGGALGAGALAALRGTTGLLEAGVDAVVARSLDLPSTGVTPFLCGFLAGISTRRAIAWLRHVASRVFSIREPALQIESVSPSLERGPVRIVVKGEGFDATARVYAEGQRLETTLVNPTTLEAETGRTSFSAGCIGVVASGGRTAFFPRGIRAGEPGDAEETPPAAHVDEAEAPPSPPPGRDPTPS